MRHEPIFASEATAARLLDMKPGQLRELVEAGHLPRPRRIGGLERFDMAELSAILRGDQIGMGSAGAMEW